jgi:hypothetical protein
MISRERIVRDSDAQIEARRSRQRAVVAARAANRMAKAVTAIERRREAEEPHAPQREVSEVLNLFRRECESLTESEQNAFEAIVKRYVVGRVSVDDWTRVTRSIRASYLAGLPPEPPIGERRVKAKDRSTSPPAGW